MGMTIEVNELSFPQYVAGMFKHDLKENLLCSNIYKKETFLYCPVQVQYLSRYMGKCQLE